MLMSHKAFAFDWRRFESDELYPLIVSALESDEVACLIAYIEKYLTELKDPYEGEPLEQTWQELLENYDVHEYSDFALTRFYNPAADLGVAEAWLEIDNSLTETERGVFLGLPIHSTATVFDPGRMGSYFQTPEQVLNSLKIVAKLCIKPVESFKKLLEDCSQNRLGIYVTF